MNYISLFLLILKLQHSEACLSGFYADNGRDQTIIERRLVRKETQKLESGLSKILGLPHKGKRPKISTPNHSAALFLKDVYNFLEEENFNAHTFDVDPQIIRNSDFIMSFMVTKNYAHSKDHRKGERILFDLSEIPSDSTVISSELRLFKLRKQISENYTVKIFEIVFNLNREKEMRFIDSKNVTNEFEGWLVFSVTSTFTSWTEYSRIRGFYVSVLKKSNPTQEIRSDEAGISLFRIQEPTSQPFLVALFKHGANGNGFMNRYVPDFSQRKKHSRESSMGSNHFKHKLSTPKNCQIQTLYIHFEELLWHEVIVAPTGYAVYYCNGLCEFPLKAQMNATNHAIIQTLAHLMDPSVAPKAICAPTQLGTLNILHYMTEYSLILKKFKDMIVLNCGCH